MDEKKGFRGIIAVNNKNFIGIEKFLPWKSSADLQHFRNLTMGCNLLVGYNTFNGLRQLDGRKLFVDTKKVNLWKPNFRYNEYDEIGKFDHYVGEFNIDYDRNINYVNSETIKDVSIDWCIGGKRTYEKYCHLFMELHISHINDDTIGDVPYPDLKNLNPNCKIFHYYFDVDK